MRSARCALISASSDMPIFSFSAILRRLGARSRVKGRGSAASSRCASTFPLARPCRSRAA
eukprot:scaffold47075_cov28-Tisochrysis_lutea.AAC.2